MVNGAKPGFQRELGGVKYRSRNERGLCATGGTLIPGECLNETILAAAAYRAGKALGPTPRKKCFPALDFSLVKSVEISITHPFLKLNWIAGHRKLLGFKKYNKITTA
jgi:hypothetical protein